MSNCLLDTCSQNVKLAIPHKQICWPKRVVFGCSKLLSRSKKWLTWLRVAWIPKTVGLPYSAMGQVAKIIGMAQSFGGSKTVRLDQQIWAGSGLPNNKQKLQPTLVTRHFLLFKFTTILFSFFLTC